jgi:hypothetical protein
MTIIYPINGKNERMGSLFKTPKHLLLYRGKQILKCSTDNLLAQYPDAQIIILTNVDYLQAILEVVSSNPLITVQVVGYTSSHVDTLRSVKDVQEGSVMFVDCDIVPETLTIFNNEYTTVFTFKNNTGLLNYSNYQVDEQDCIVSCNEKEEIFENAGAGIYYFPSMELFMKYSQECKSISECINKMLLDNIITKINQTSIIHRFGTLQDIYIDNFSFREPQVVDLSTGFTSNKVTKVDTTVVKCGNTIVDEYKWYHSYKNKKHIPTILNCKSDELVMEFVYRDADLNLDDVFTIVDEYATYPKLNDLTFDSYITSIGLHLEKNSKINNGYKLLDLLRTIYLPATFAHGDLSIMNIIPTKLGLKLIDPLYSETKFGSYELDMAKLCFSVKYYKNDSGSFNYIKNKLNPTYSNILIASEAVRVSTYKSEYSFIAENLINELYS